VNEKSCQPLWKQKHESTGRNGMNGGGGPGPRYFAKIYGRLAETENRFVNA
jgi:hypothetical protein